MLTLQNMPVKTLKLQNMPVKTFKFILVFGVCKKLLANDQTANYAQWCAGLRIGHKSLAHKRGNCVNADFYGKISFLI